MSENSNQVDSEKLLKDLSFCVFDLETTGGNHSIDKIIEIGLVRVENLAIKETKAFLINPEIRIPEFIQKLTGLGPDDVKDSHKIEEVMDEILEFMGDSILVAHNTSFDIPFFNSVLTRLKRSPLPNKNICTNLMTKYLIPNIMNSNLNYMSKVFGIDHEKAHRALDDAVATSYLLIRYLKIFIHKDIKKINHLYYPRNRYELDRSNFKTSSHNNEDVFKTVKTLETPGLITLKGENGVILFALPFTGSEKEKKYICEQVKSIKWENITIKIFGPFIEAFVNFIPLFNKIDMSLKIQIVKFLWEQHLPKKPFQGFIKENSEVKIEQMEKKRGKDHPDFIIAHHLVPEQYVIYPTASLFHKSGLIFRFPGHKKKLFQFISSRTGKLMSNKMKKSNIHPSLSNFLNNYLLESKDERTELFFFQKVLPLNNQADFVKELEEFLSQNQDPYRYPKEYI
jgi:DNA polymerase-3 subunit epsilon